MIRINLLPHRERKREALRKQIAILAGMTAFLGILIIVAVHVAIDSRINYQNARNNYLKQQIAILDAQQFAHPIDVIAQVTTTNDLLAMQEQLKSVYVDNLIKQYIVQIVDRTRSHADVYLGASPRGALAMYRTAQARAAVHGRDYVIPDDIKALARVTLGHRVIISPSARIKDSNANGILDEILRSTPVPGTKVRA